jgi:hypothetical protein
LFVALFGALVTLEQGAGASRVGFRLQDSLDPSMLLQQLLTFFVNVD